MAHRFNSEYGRPTPKPSASERTWYRWRLKHGYEEQKDIVRRSKLEEVKEKIREAFFNKLRKQKKESS